MDNLHAHRAIQKIAAREGISEAQVVADMERAMEEMRQDAYAAEDAGKIAFWESLSQEGKRPTAYDFVEYLSRFIHNMT